MANSVGPAPLTSAQAYAILTDGDEDNDFKVLGQKIGTGAKRMSLTDLQALKAQGKLDPKSLENVEIAWDGIDKQHAAFVASLDKRYGGKTAEAGAAFKTFLESKGKPDVSQLSAAEFNSLSAEFSDKFAKDQLGKLMSNPKFAARVQETLGTSDVSSLKPAQVQQAMGLFGDYLTSGDAFSDKVNTDPAFKAKMAKSLGTTDWNAMNDAQRAGALAGLISAGISGFDEMIAMSLHFLKFIKSSMTEASKQLAAKRKQMEALNKADQPLIDKQAERNKITPDQAKGDMKSQAEALDAEIKSLELEKENRQATKDMLSADKDEISMVMQQLAGEYTYFIDMITKLLGKREKGMTTPIQAIQS